MAWLGLTWLGLAWLGLAWLNWCFCQDGGQNPTERNTTTQNRSHFCPKKWLGPQTTTIEVHLIFFWRPLPHVRGARYPPTRSSKLRSFCSLRPMNKPQGLGVPLIYWETQTRLQQYWGAASVEEPVTQNCLGVVPRLGCIRF